MNHLRPISALWTFRVEDEGYEMPWLLWVEPLRPSSGRHLTRVASGGTDLQQCIASFGTPLARHWGSLASTATARE